MDTTTSIARDNFFIAMRLSHLCMSDDQESYFRQLLAFLCTV